MLPSLGFVGKENSLLMDYSAWVLVFLLYWRWFNIKMRVSCPRERSKEGNAVHYIYIYIYICIYINIVHLRKRHFLKLLFEELLFTARSGRRIKRSFRSGLSVHLLKIR
jgi:hypothetical protein